MKFVKKNYIYFIILLVLILVVISLLNDISAETNSNMTIIGDSRMVGLCSYNWYKEDKGTCIAKTSMGYNWLVTTAIKEVEKLDDDKKVNIAVNLGVNDLYNVDNYIKEYRELAETLWKDSKIFIVSVNPTKGSYSKLNSKIDEFNQRLKESLNNYNNIFYCDTSSYLKEHGFETSDGLHYDSKTSKIIYNQIKKCVY